MSLEIDPHVEQALVRLADMQNVTVNYLLRDFTEKQARYLKEREEDAARFKNMKQNGGISEQDMKAHFEGLREATTKSQAIKKPL